MNNTNKTIKDLIEELEKIQNIKDRRLAVLLLHLYSEHYIIKLCEINNIKEQHKYICECGKSTGSRALSFSENVDKLIEKNVLENELYEPFKLLNKIRHRLVHDLSPNNEEILKLIEKYKPKATTEALYSMLKNEDPWIKFYISLIAAIANVYKKISNTTDVLEVIEKNRLTGRWIFHIKVQAKD